MALGTGGKEPYTLLVSSGEVTNRKTVSHADQRGYVQGPVATLLRKAWPGLALCG